jgi:hypothetical protein
MRLTTATLVAGTAGWACTGSYEVGRVYPADLSSPPSVDGSLGDIDASDGGVVVGGSGSTLAPSAGGGGSMSAGPGEITLAPDCVPPGAPDALSGPFASPAVVWTRLSPVIWGSKVDAPFALPQATTYTWASDVAQRAFEQARDTELRVPGAELFARRFLQVEPSTPLLGGYGSWLAAESPALPVLLSTSLPHATGELGARMGIFGERSWLLAHPSISSRGAAMRSILFDDPVPPHPDGFDVFTPDASLTERADLEQRTNDPSCLGCHSRIDGLGFALGNFDAAGAYRERDAGLEIDTSGALTVPSGDTLEFPNLAALVVRVGANCEANLTLADTFLRFALSQQGLSAEDQQTVFQANQRRVQQGFVYGGRHYLALVRAFAQSPAALGP